MKWAYYVQHKLKAAFVLTGIIVVVLLNNFLDRRNFSNLDETMVSINNDRLKPAAYIFEISSNLYRKRLLHDENNFHTPEQLSALAVQYNRNIALLMKDYETTVLTTEEKKQWTAFRQNLQNYNDLEASWLRLHNDNREAATAMHGNIDRRFDATMQTLDKLNRIQVGEGDNLTKSTHSIVNSTMVMSYLEISLLIILGIFALVILSVSDNALFRQQQNQVWN
ncbi:MCP four helix bundle domain-containing protein [Polluticoccus soli]|uniref:MCP four helix bundle domain-containing protein n=1 Tax=Polluticoccus soli TaxID=3034150 RepID=UPI0023E3001C|nr:MCP four helix bundle domain-containing protein [Flavipsychrobacter sp. JY13-12]